MNRYFITPFVGLIVAFCVMACNSEETVYPAPTSIPESAFSWEEGIGSVIFSWDTPEDADFYYVRVDYTVEGEARTRLASRYSNGIEIDNLQAKYGPIEFTFQTFNRDGSKGGDTIVKITAQAGKAPYTYSYGNPEKLDITGDGDAWTNAQESNEGPLANLFDGDASTYFHTPYTTTVAYPHIIVVDMKEKPGVVKFTFTNRNHDNKSNPSEIQVYASEDFDGEDYDYEGLGLTRFATLSDLPSGQASSYESSYIDLGAAGVYQYLWIAMMGSTSGSTFLALSILEVYKATKYAYDQEEDYTFEMY